MSVHRVSDPAVKAAFEAYPQELRSALEDLRRIILETAGALTRLGKIEETLKGGLPAYRPEASRDAALRIGPVWGADGDADYALLAPGETSLGDLSALYPDQLRISDGNAIVFRLGDVPPEIPLRHAIALALTVHTREDAEPPRQLADA